MKLSGNKLTYASPRFITVATLVATLFFAPGVVLAIDKDAHEDRVQSKKQELLAALKKDNVTIIGESQYPGYNAPWTPPWMTRNEVLIEIV